MKTAAIIVNHNNRADLEKLLSRIRAYEVFDAVVVVDNQSDNVEWIEDIAADSVISYNGKIHLIKADKNGGYSYGNNKGMLWAHNNGYTHAVIAKPDTEFSEDCVKAMLREFENDPSDGQVAVVAPVCITPESDYDAPKTGWFLKTWGQELISRGPVCRRIFKGFVAGDDMDIVKACIEGKSSDNPAEIKSTSITVGAVLGSLLSVDVSKFMEAGGYDEEVFLYCEENILGQKMKSLNYTTKLIIDHEYHHNHKPNKPSMQAMERLTESELYYMEKYLHTSGFQMFISRVFFDIVCLEIKLFSNKHSK